MRVFTLVFLSLLILSCKIAKNKEQGNNERFVVSFISKGPGTDGKAIDQFKTFITEFEKKKEVKIPYTTARWGREGEIDFCFKMQDIKSKIQEAFISETKKLLESSDLVRYKENCPCKEGAK